MEIVRGKNGGKRPGAGVKKGTIFSKTVEASEIRAYWRKRLAQDQEPLYEAMRNKAKGCAVIDKKSDGDLIYDLPPDPQAFKALVEHSIGKAPETVEISGKDGKAIEIKWQ